MIAVALATTLSQVDGDGILRIWMRGRGGPGSCEGPLRNVQVYDEGNGLSSSICVIEENGTRHIIPEDQIREIEVFPPDVDPEEDE